MLMNFYYFSGREEAIKITGHHIVIVSKLLQSTFFMPNVNFRAIQIIRDIRGEGGGAPIVGLSNRSESGAEFMTGAGIPVRVSAGLSILILTEIIFRSTLSSFYVYDSQFWTQFCPSSSIPPPFSRH